MARCGHVWWPCVNLRAGHAGQSRAPQGGGGKFSTGPQTTPSARCGGQGVVARCVKARCDGHAWWPGVAAKCGGQAWPGVAMCGGHVLNPGQGRAMHPRGGPILNGPPNIVSGQVWQPRCGGQVCDL